MNTYSFAYLPVSMVFIYSGHISVTYVHLQEELGTNSAYFALSHHH